MLCINASASLSILVSALLERADFLFLLAIYGTEELTYFKNIAIGIDYLAEHKGVQVIVGCTQNRTKFHDKPETGTTP